MLEKERAVGEKWDAYGPRREKLGYELLRGQILPRGVRHLVAHMLYYNGKGQVLLQRRSESRPLAPGLWALTGGSALAGETSWQDCIRERDWVRLLRNAPTFARGGCAAFPRSRD